MMDIYQYPTLEMYWGLRGCLQPLQVIVDALSYERFKEIRESLKVENCNVMSQMLCKQVQSVLKMSGHLSVDEQLRKFNGRFSGKVTIGRKPAGTGCNCIVLACGVNKVPWWYSIEGVGETNVQELGILKLI